MTVVVARPVRLAARELDVLRWTGRVGIAVDRQNGETMPVTYILSGPWRPSLLHPGGGRAELGDWTITAPDGVIVAYCPNEACGRRVVDALNRAGGEQVGRTEERR